MSYGDASGLSCVGAMLEHYQIHIPKVTNVMLS